MKGIKWKKYNFGYSDVISGKAQGSVRLEKPHHPAFNKKTIT